MAEPQILCLDCGETSHGWAIPAGKTDCATCGSSNTVRIDDLEDRQAPLDTARDEPLD